MHKSTPSLAAQVRRAESLHDKTALLRNRYEGETCVIVTCGPSLADVPEARLRESLKGVLTIAVKQAIDVVGDQTDFLCWNAFNVARFSSPSPHTVGCFVADPTGRRPQFNHHDLKFPQVHGNGGLANSLAYKCDFPRHLIADDVVRPFGPGIMYELVVYLALHLGVSELITVGWDIANSAGGNAHFYDDDVDRPYFESERAGPPAPTTLRSRVPEPVRYGVRFTKNAIAHSRRGLYNKTRTLPGETEVVARSTVELAAWLEKEGVALKAVTDSPHLANRIGRLDLDDLWSRLAEIRSP